MTLAARTLVCFAVAALWAGTSWGTLYTFSTGAPDGKIATASRPSGGGKIETETGDDFIAPPGPLTIINSATFTGLLTGTATTSDIGEVRVEIYRVFPKDSDTTRTSGPPDNSTSQVPTRNNSPSDVELVDRDTASGNLIFTTTDLGAFTASNSVINGINPKPNQTTQGEGPVTGEEIQFNVTFTTPFILAPDHYFFVPQVEVTTADNFLWLSAPKPITDGTGPFLPDLQSWIRNENLAPDWLRIGTDVVGPIDGVTSTFNASFSLAGQTPEPTTLLLVGVGLVAGWWVWRRHKGPH